MNRLKSLTIFVSACVVPLLLPFTQAHAEPDDFDKTLEEYDRRLRLLEEEGSHEGGSVHEEKTFNPAISVILDGIYTSYKNDPEDYKLPGYVLGGEAGLATEGFSLGHSEIIFRSHPGDD